MDRTNTTYLNKNFRFVFSPNKYNDSYYLPFLGKRIGLFSRKRFLVSANQLSEYITEKNAKTVILATEKMKTDKMTIKFRKYGKIEIYVK